MVGVDSVAIAVGLTGNETSQKMMAAVEWHGVQNQVEMLARAQDPATALDTVHVSLISSMGTTNPKPPPYEGGEDLFWKLQAEALLALNLALRSAHSRAQRYIMTHVPCHEHNLTYPYPYPNPGCSPQLNPIRRPSCSPRG